MQTALTNAKVIQEIPSTVSSKGQVTIPQQVRRLMAIKPRDRVAFRNKELIQDIPLTVSSKGQVTIPQQVRRLMAIKPRDQIIFRVEQQGSKALVTVSRSTALSLGETQGSVQPISRPEDLKRLRDLALEEKVEHELEKNAEKG